MGYLPQAIKGVGWSVALRAGIRAVTFFRIIILARFFLSPQQFGVFGIASLFVAFLDVTTETGVQVFLIQEKSRLEKYISAAWIVSIVRGFLFGLIIACIAPIAASFYKNAQILSLLLVFSLFPIIEGFINPAEITFQKELSFSKEFFYRFLLYCTESIAVVAISAITKNAIAFVGGILISTAAEVFASFIFISPKPLLIFELNKIKTILHRGKWVTAFGMFNYLAQEADSFVVGKLLGPDLLAFYQTGYKFSTLPVSEVSDVVSKVVFPVYAKFQEDKKRLWRAFLMTTLLISAGSLLLGCIIIFFGKEIILFSLGTKWIQVISILPILTAYGVLRAISGSASAVFLAVCKQNYVAVMTGTRFLGLICTIIPLTLYSGLMGASFSALASVIIEIPIILYFVYQIFGKKSKLRERKPSFAPEPLIDSVLKEDMITK